MEKVKYLILGAGPAGLTFANMLKRKGEESFLILEKEKEAGGLCRSAEVDGSPLDIGGGHFLDVRRCANFCLISCQRRSGRFFAGTAVFACKARWWDIPWRPISGSFP